MVISRIGRDYHQQYGYLKRYLQYIPACVQQKKRAVDILDSLIYFDPCGYTTFEVSCKVSPEGILPHIRFLNMDARGYSYQKTSLFLTRLSLYEMLMKNTVRWKTILPVIDSLKGVSRFPVDLYFGADILKDSTQFAFWLIWGGVQRNGNVSFCDYPVPSMLKELFRGVGSYSSVHAGKNLMNFGFDVNARSIYCKLYYLLKDDRCLPVNLTLIKKQIDSNVKSHKFFYFYSLLFDHNGDCKKEKLFIEFLEDVYPYSRGFSRLMDNLFSFIGSSCAKKAVVDLLERVRGRVSLISFEPQGSITVYIRS